MAKAFSVSIIAPDRTVYEGKALSLIAPSRLGYLGILADHAPLISTLADGKITITEDSCNKQVFNTKGGGVLDVLKNNVTLLLSSGH